MDDTIRITHWINDNLQELSQLDNNKGIEIINNCGKNCCKLSDLYKGACKVSNENKQADTDTLFHNFKEEYYHSDKSDYFTKKGNTITLIFDKCTCPMVKKGVNNSFLCNCTTGYSQKLCETLFRKAIRVDLQKSILQGDSICEQRVTILS